MDQRTRATVCRFRLTRDAASRRIHELAKDSKNLRWTSHIRERMVERSIDTDAVLRVLRMGDVEDDPELISPKNWKVKIVCQLANRRCVGVVTILIDEAALRLVTAEWEDGR